MKDIVLFKILDVHYCKMGVQLQSYYLSALINVSIKYKIQRYDNH